MKAKTEKRCGCRDPRTGRQYARGACPDLAGRTHGTWSYRFRVPKELVPLVGKSELSGTGYPTKVAAERAADDAIASVRAGQQHVGGLTVGKYLTEQWLPGKRKLRPSTRARYEQFIRLYLVPYLGDLPLTGLRADHIDTMFRRIEATNGTRRNPVGPATLGDIRDCLRAALNHAMRQRMVAFNAAVGVELPEHTTPEVDPWEAEEAGVFLDEASNDRLFALFELAALHGLRRGELCGATWDGLDDMAGTLTIRQQITDAANTLGVWAPKTKSGRRKVDIDPTTLGSLLAWRLTQDAEREDVGPVWDNGTLPNERGELVKLSGLIFTRPNGQHLDPQYVTRRMQQIARRAGLLATIRRDVTAGATVVYVGKLYRDAVGAWTLYVDREPVADVEVTAVQRIHGSAAWLTLSKPLPVDLADGAELGRGLLSRRRLHDLRHGSASIQLAAGVDLTLVSKRLGHSSTAITSSLYVHLLRSSGQAAAQTVANAIPRSARRGHDVGTAPGAGTKPTGPKSVVAGQRAGLPALKITKRAEDAGFEPEDRPNAAGRG